jgi:hypothetical protein
MTPISWNNPVDRITIKPYMFIEMEQIIQIKHNLKIARDRQKICADRKRTPREFETEDHMYL